MATYFRYLIITFLCLPLFSCGGGGGGGGGGGNDQPPIRVNCGGLSYVDSEGNSWLDDSYFSDGEWFSDFTRKIEGTDDDFLYQSERCQDVFYYRIPVNNGMYSVRLHFSEIYWAEAGKRIFNVLAEDEVVIRNLDILVATEGVISPYVYTHEVYVGDGELSLDFIASNDLAKISAIEVIPL